MIYQRETASHLLQNGEKLQKAIVKNAQMSHADLIVSLKQIELPLPILSEVKSLIVAVQNFRNAGHCVGIVEGMGKTGKSIAINSCLKKDLDSKGIIINLVNGSMASIGASILMAAGAPIIRIQTPERMSDYVARQLKIRNINIVIFDNVDLILTEGQSHPNTLTFIVQLVQRLNCGIIIVGRNIAPFGNEISYALAGATSKCAMAHPFPARNPKDMETLAAAITIMQINASNIVGHLVSLEVLRSERMAHRMFYASRGRIGIICLIIIDGIHECLQNGIKVLDHKILAESWRRMFAKDPETYRNITQNPFLMIDAPSIMELRDMMKKQEAILGSSSDLPQKTKGKGARLWTT